MSKATVSALSGVVVAALAALVSSGVLNDSTVATWQPVVVAVIAFAGTVGIRSARAPK